MPMERSASDGDGDAPFPLRVERADFVAVDPERGMVDGRRQAAQELVARDGHVLGQRQDLASSHRHQPPAIGGQIASSSSGCSARVARSAGAT